MKGTNAVQMRPMLFTPPKITAPTNRAINTPTAMRAVVGSNQSAATRQMFSLIALACTALPMPNAAIAVNRLNNTASHFMPSPFSRAYMGPPSILPSFVLTRYLMARSPSLYFVAMPKIPVSQHHSTAPGPPIATAVATPIMLPVPMVAASELAKAANWLTSPVEPLSFFTEIFRAVHILRCGTRRRMVRKRCVPRRRIIIGQPHTHPLIVFVISRIVFMLNVQNSSFETFTFAEPFCRRSIGRHAPITAWA